MEVLPWQQGSRWQVGPRRLPVTAVSVGRMGSTDLPWWQRLMPVSECCPPSPTRSVESQGAQAGRDSRGERAGGATELGTLLAATPKVAGEWPQGCTRRRRAGGDAAQSCGPRCSAAGGVVGTLLPVSVKNTGDPSQWGRRGLSPSWRMDSARLGTIQMSAVQAGARNRVVCGS